MCFVLNNNDVGSEIFISDLSYNSKGILSIKKKIIHNLFSYQHLHEIKDMVLHIRKTHHIHPRDYCLPFDKISLFL